MAVGNALRAKAQERDVRLAAERASIATLAVERASIAVNVAVRESIATLVAVQASIVIPVVVQENIVALVVEREDIVPLAVVRVSGAICVAPQALASIALTETATIVGVQERKTALTVVATEGVRLVKAEDGQGIVAIHVLRAEVPRIAIGVMAKDPRTATIAMALENVGNVMAVGNAQLAMGTLYVVHVTANLFARVAMAILSARAATAILFARAAMARQFVRAAMVRQSARPATVRLFARPVAAMVTVLIARTATANVRRAQGRARSHFHH